MAVVLHPRAHPGRGLQVWCSATGLSGVPALDWRLDGRPAAPVAVRPMAGARPPAMLSAPVGRAFTGVYEFRDGIAPGSTHDVTVTLPSGESAALRTQVLPDEVPRDPFQSFNVLLASCYHRAEDKAGAVAALVAGLPVPHRPHLALLAGDQVYLDLPTLMNFEGTLPWLADRFERTYVDNWFGSYAGVLGCAPSAAIPDDHEYWNNAPHPSPIVQESIGAGSRANWLAAAAQMFTAFQRSEPGGYERMLELDVPPLSFFLMDNRTFRSPDRVRTLPPGGLVQFQDWARRLRVQGLYGVVVTGQSLFQPPAPWFTGVFGDRHLSNYDDYPGIMSTLVRLAQDGRPVLCLTGDVHYGRILGAHDARTGAELYEVISSPASLVTSVGVDQFAGLANKVKGLFGHSDPTYRHRSAPAPPDSFTPTNVDTKFYLRQKYPLHGEKGNHVALLRFRRAGFGLELTVSYWLVGAGRAPVETTISLSPTW